MAYYELKNDEISIGIESCGAELKSLKRSDNHREYMWCGDPQYWGRTSPILFPFVGGLKDRKYLAKGNHYSMTQHGFARDMEFRLLSRTEDEIWFEMDSDEETMAKFPYAFILKAGYRIEGSRVEVMWQVENPGTEKLPFSIGGHPAFNCPLEEECSQEECFVDFGNVGEVVSTRIGASGLALEDTDTYRLAEGKLPLTDTLFDHDALVIENRQTQEVSLCGKGGIRYLTVTMDAPLFGVWSPAGKKAPFVCIEPWYGRCDDENFQGALEDRKWGNTVMPGEVWKASYTICVRPD